MEYVPGPAPRSLADADADGWVASAKGSTKGWGSYSKGKGRFGKSSSKDFSTKGFSKGGKKGSRSLVLHGRELELSEELLEQHPGGPDVLLAYEGCDCTQEFEAVGHSASAMRWSALFEVPPSTASNNNGSPASPARSPQHSSHGGSSSSPTAAAAASGHGQQSPPSVAASQERGRGQAARRRSSVGSASGSGIGSGKGCSDDGLQDFKHMLWDEEAEPWDKLPIALALVSLASAAVAAWQLRASSNTHAIL